MKIVYFFRKPSTSFHSIEGLFSNVQGFLSDQVEYSNYHSKFHSRGILGRVWNAMSAAFNQGEINHITGDIHYIALFLQKQKTVLTIHDLNSILRGGGLKRRILKFFWFTMPLARVQYVTVVSEFTKKELLDQFNIEENKVRVIYDCISPALKFKKRTLANEVFTILQVGTKLNKNLENLVRAIEGIECRLVIVGVLTPVQTEMLKRAKVNFVVHNNIDFSSLVELYETADLLAFISKYEGFGMPLLEANAVGTPVIAGNVASIPEVAGEAALLVDPENVDEIREGIVRLIEDESLRQNLIEKGLINVNRFSGEKIAGDYYELYREIVNNS